MGWCIPEIGIERKSGDRSNSKELEGINVGQLTGQKTGHLSSRYCIYTKFQYMYKNYPILIQNVPVRINIQFYIYMYFRCNKFEYIQGGPFKRGHPNVFSNCDNAKKYSLPDVSGIQTSISGKNTLFKHFSGSLIFFSYIVIILFFL